MNRVVFLDAAEEEMLEAAKFYGQQVPDLGRRYLGAIQHTVSLIESNPQLGSPQQENIRRLIVKRFPYALLYRTDSHEIEISRIGMARLSVEKLSCLAFNVMKLGTGTAYAACCRL